MRKILKIYTIKDKKEEKVLRKVSKEVSKDEILSREFQLFLDNLLFTAQKVETEEGYSSAGLASIQVGVDKRVFCILNESDAEFELMINLKLKY